MDEFARRLRMLKVRCEPEKAGAFSRSLAGRGFREIFTAAESG
jgi:hypothetical protein